MQVCLEMNVYVGNGAKQTKTQIDDCVQGSREDAELQGQIWKEEESPSLISKVELLLLPSEILKHLHLSRKRRQRADRRKQTLVGQLETTKEGERVMIRVNDNNKATPNICQTVPATTPTKLGFLFE